MGNIGFSMFLETSGPAQIGVLRFLSLRPQTGYLRSLVDGGRAGSSLYTVPRPFLRVDPGGRRGNFVVREVGGKQREGGGSQGPSDNE